MLFIKWNVTPCSLGRSPGRWGAPLTRGGAGSLPPGSICLGEGCLPGGRQSPPPFRSPPGGGFEKGDFPLYLSSYFFSRRKAVFIRFSVRSFIG